MSGDALKGSRHPYYAQEGNYYSNDCHTEFESWSDFLDDMGDADLDMNLIYRWDWYVPDPDDYSDEPEEMPDHDTLRLYYVGQRKARLHSMCVAVRPDDEADVREWLTVRAEHMRLLWAPLLDRGQS